MFNIDDGILSDVPMLSVMSMLTHRKYITQYHFDCKYHSTDWWLGLATFMPHLTWLSIQVTNTIGGVSDNAPFLKQGPPNLMYLSVLAVRYPHCALTSLSLRLPALETLELDDEKEKDFAKKLREVKFECPSLRSLSITMHAKQSMLTSWFAHLRFLDVTIHDVSVCFLTTKVSLINDMKPFWNSRVYLWTLIQVVKFAFQNT